MCSNSSDAPDRSSGRVLAVLAALVATPLLGGCLSIHVPDDFLVVAEDASQIKARSPDDARLWVREFDDSHQGDFAFWSATLEHDLVENRGYTLVAESTSEDSQDREGRELVFEMTVQGVPHRYLIALFVIEGWLSNTVRTVEFVAPKEAFERYAEEVRRSVGTLGP